MHCTKQATDPTATEPRGKLIVTDRHGHVIGRLYQPQPYQPKQGQGIYTLIRRMRDMADDKSNLSKAYISESLDWWYTLPMMY